MSTPIKVITSVLLFLFTTAYAILGGIAVNNWLLTSSSGLDNLNAVIIRVEAANENYSPSHGYIFATAGILLALGWGIYSIRSKLVKVSVNFIVWCLILTAGAPALFIASFSNLMSIGDTFYTWNPEASFLIERWFYLVSLISFIAGLSVFVTVIVNLYRSQKRGSTLKKTREESSLENKQGRVN